eukprot:6209596-Pleurochrysis_carterae.AAC.4
MRRCQAYDRAPTGRGRARPSVERRSRARARSGAANGRESAERGRAGVASTRARLEWPLWLHARADVVHVGVAVPRARDKHLAVAWRTHAQRKDQGWSSQVPR